MLHPRNVTHAGVALHVSQLSMCGILSHLREAFDNPLLVPVIPYMRLTRLAESLLGAAQQLITHVDALPVFDPATARCKVVASTFLWKTVCAIQHEARGLHFELVPPTPAWRSEFDTARFDYATCSSLHCVRPPHLDDSD